MLVVSIGFFISHVPAQDEILSPWEEQVLLDRHVLAGVKKISVQILPTNEDFNKNLPPWDNLPAKVKQQFDEARIEIVMRPISYEQPNTSISPVLEIVINTLEIKDSHKSVFHIQTSLKTKVHLPSKPSRYIKAVVWETEPVMKAIHTDDAMSLLAEEVIEQVKAFICAYQAADSPDTTELLNTRSTDNEENNTPPPIQTRQSLAKNQEVQTQFSASKNSKVFHKNECQWTQKIKRENLVVYSTRDEAINVGRRPCKQCKP
jgi:hypothetical protein